VYLRDSAASCDAEDAISQPRRAAIFRGNRFWSWWLPGICAVGGAACALAAEPRSATVGLLAVMSVVAGMHARRTGDATAETPRGPGGLSVKRFAGVKSIVVSVAWAVAAIGLCLLESPAPVTRPVVVASLWLAALLTPVLFADSLLLDLRDRAADRTFGLHTIAVRVGPRGVHAMVGPLLAAAAIATVLGAHAAIDGDRWLRTGIAATLGLALPWFGWRAIRRDEVATASTIMAWRLLAALAVL
jgi:1,4-dihydroxy-2-naphthoate octaprenyltransferase